MGWAGGGRTHTDTQTHLTGLQECSKDQQCQARASGNKMTVPSHTSILFLSLSFCLSVAFMCCMLQFSEATKFTFVLLPLSLLLHLETPKSQTPCCLRPCLPLVSSSSTSAFSHVMHTLRRVDYLHELSYVSYTHMAKIYRVSAR